MSKKLPEITSAEEIDLGQLFKLIGNAFERFFKFLGAIFNKLFLGFVWMVFFLKKHFLKIAIAGVIGFGIGVVRDKISGPKYVSSVTVRQNYATGENLYDLIEYYNSLTKQKDLTPISEVLLISDKEASNIIGFEIEPVVSENSRIKNYDSYIKELDSTIASGIDYETYIDNTMMHDYNEQKISIRTKEPKNLLPIFQQITDKLSKTEFFKTRQKRDIEELNNRELALKQAIIESDSLKSTYKRVLEKNAEITESGKPSQTSFTIEGSNNKNQTKEFELFQSDLEIRRELVAIERQKQDKEEIIEIVSSEFTSGTIDNMLEVFGKEINKNIVYAFILSILAFFSLLSLEMNKYLDRYKDKV